MLVLSRKVGEKLRIGDNIEVVVVEVKGDTVRLGITAPQGISIHREEIYVAIQAENKSAAGARAKPADMKSFMARFRGTDRSERSEE